MPPTVASAVARVVEATARVARRRRLGVAGLVTEILCDRRPAVTGGCSRPYGVRGALGEDLWCSPAQDRILPVNVRYRNGCLVTS